jgi:hypothetical protein
MNLLGRKDNTTEPPQPRRMYERRNCDTCVTQIDEQVYPVENWSQGGVLLSGDSKFLGQHQVYNLTLKFKLRDRILNITQPARVIRKGGTKTALQFLPLPQDIRNAFHQVIDDWVASNFANSQA